LLAVAARPDIATAQRVVDERERNPPVASVSRHLRETAGGDPKAGSDRLYYAE